MAKGQRLTCYCGTGFTASNNRQKYCSNKCAQRLLQKLWRDDNPDKKAAIAKRYKDRHPERVNAQKRAWEAKQREKLGIPQPRKKGDPLPRKGPRASSKIPTKNGKWDAAEYYLRKLKGDRLLRTYGITQDDYNRMLEEQDGKCAICRQPEAAMGTGGKVRALCVDHNRKTGRVRALLCANCNLGIGNLQESPELMMRAIEYVTAWA